MSNSNYLYTHTVIVERQGVICLQDELDQHRLRHKEFVEKYLAPAVKESKCGWDNLKYVCIKYPNSDYAYPYMVLYVGNKPERWIPVDGNSDGCNLQVIGENIW
jgi:hypothetical protein